MSHRKYRVTTPPVETAGAWEVRRRMAPASAIARLSRIPGVGPSIAADLCLLGVREVAELRGRNAESLYAELCREVGGRVDRCVLYVFRCAVYFASESKHDPELLKWWNWKDTG
jgi:predicted flap endonuclease-1-like 5' DNA nuclease